MSNDQKVFFTAKRGIVILILYSITIMVYFAFFYKSLELMPTITGYPEISSSNELLKSMNREYIMFFLIFSFLGVVITLLIGTIIYEEIVLFMKPTIAVNAKLKSKESAMQMTGSHTGSSYIGYTYSLTFEVDEGEDINFAVIPKYYWTIIEGNKGILKYKKGRVKRFVGFDLISID